MNRKHSKWKRGRAALITAFALVAPSLTVVGALPASAAPVVVASDLTAGPPLNLVGFTDDPAIPFTSPADGFNVFQRGVSATIPFDLLDDSLSIFPLDSQGIVDETNLDPFFGIVDTNNGDTGGAAVTSTWVFDITDASDMSISIDLGAMGDFEASDSYEFAYSIDGSPAVPLWSLTADESSSRSYTMAGGLVFTYNDPLNLGAIPLSNVLQTIPAPITGTGSLLTLTVTADTNGGGEAVVFQNIVITGETGGGPSDPVINELVADHTGPDTAAFVEVLGDPSTDYSAFTILEIEGDSTGAGMIDAVLPIGTTDADGYWTDPEDMENGTITILLVEGFSGSLGMDLDTNNDGAFDLTPWSRIVDDVAPTDGGGSDVTYSTSVLGPFFDGSPFGAGGASRLPNGIDTDVAGDWTRNDFDGFGFPGFIGSPALGEAENTPGAVNVALADPVVLELIHDVQGSGPAVAIPGPVIVEGIVTSLFSRDDVLDGFFVQEEDADADADPATSEGIFVFCRGNCPGSIATGDLVMVTGSAVEFFGMSQIDMTSGSAVVGSSGNPLPIASSVDLPAAASTLAEPTFENVEGMMVTFPDSLVVSEYFQLGRFGQIVLTESARPYQFTDDNLPSVAGNAAFQAELAKRRIILDDDNNDNNDVISDGPDEAYYYPEGGLSLGNKFRGGDTITNLTGVMHWSFAGFSGTDAWRVRPIPDAFDYTFVPVNPAPAGPSPVGGTVNVASFNVLNYFTTIDLTSSNSSGNCGPSGTLDCRGADSPSELARQRAKIVAAMAQLDADVLGLIELENDGDDSSIADLVAGLNAAPGGGSYEHISTGFIGADAIKVGLIYDAATVSPLGGFAILDDSVDPLFVESKNRPVLIQTFVENATSERFTVAVNHLKSKGSPCDDVGDPGLNDGQANCPATRTAGTTALANYLATDPTGSGDPDFLILGDLNAYAMEAPITALVGAGYTDLLALFEGTAAYSFVFDGQLGYLDHALANDTLLGQTTGAGVWHINSDEVNIFDYNDEINDTGEASFERESAVFPVYAPDALRSSDHDPVLVGLLLDSIPDNPTCNGLPATIIGTPGDDVITGTNQSDVIVAFGGDDTIASGNGQDVICAGFGDDTVDGGNGKDILFGEAGDDTLAGDNGKDTLDGGDGTDIGDGGNGQDVCTNLEDAISCES